MNITKMTLYLVTAFILDNFVPNCCQAKVFTPIANESCSVDRTSRVTLKGNMRTGTTRSKFQPIDVLLGDRCLTVHSLVGIGEVQIIITNQINKTVLFYEITPSIDKFIDIKKFPKENYEIKFVNKNREYLLGEFILN